MPLSLQDLADRIEIAAIRPRFGRAADLRDWPAMTALFATQVDVDLSAFGGPAARMAREDLVALFRHAFRNPEIRTQQLYGSVEVEVVGDGATCRSYLQGRHASTGFPGGDLFELHAEYTDRLERGPDGWRISGTVLRVIAMSGNPGLIS